MLSFVGPCKLRQATDLVAWPSVSTHREPVAIGAMSQQPPARTDGAKPQPKIDGQPSPLYAAAVTNGSITREVERRSPEVALSYAVASAAPSTSGSSTRESDSSGPVQKINSTLIDIDVTSARWRGRARLSSLSILTRWSICAGRPKGVWPAALASYLIFRRSLGGRRRPASRPPRRALRRAPRPPRRRRRRAAPSAPETRSDLMSIFSNAVAATNCLAAHRHQSSQSNENQYYTRAAALLLRNK